MNRLRERREELGFTIKEVAEKVDVHFTTISEWELEKTIPRPRKKNLLTNVLDCEKEYLFPDDSNETSLARATHQGELIIGDKKLSCAVLEDGTRIITVAAVFEAFGRPPRGKILTGNRAINVPSFLDAQNLQPFVSEELREMIKQIDYFTKTGKKSYGYDAKIIPLVCDVYLAARQSGILRKPQFPLAEASEILVRSLSKVGIIALVDEATGYQAVRDRDELHRLLAIYLSEERLKWAKMFPDAFYQHLYRLKNWDYPTNNNRSPYVGKLTNDLVYDKLPPGVLEELKKRNPINPTTKRRRWKHFQYLSEDIGQPDLRDHLLQLIAVMRAAPDWYSFEFLFERAFPTPGKQMKLALPAATQME